MGQRATEPLGMSFGHLCNPSQPSILDHDLDLKTLDVIVMVTATMRLE